MPTNPYFRNYDNFYEQNLIDDLVIESIRMYGIDVIYVTRSNVGIDTIFNETDTPIFDQTFEFETYIKNVDGFEGEGDFLSRFGLQIRDQITFTVARRTFERYVTKEKPNHTRPFEGDLVYFPLNDKMFEIKFVEHESVFYQTGDLQVFDLRCELMEYSNERFQTGRENIDNYYWKNYTTANSANNDVVTTLESLAITDTYSQNLDFEQTADGILDFTEIDPFSEQISIPDNN